MIAIETSGMLSDSQPSHLLVDDKPSRCILAPKENSYFIIDLKNLSVCPIKYSLRHYNSFDTECLRNWVFQGFDKKTGNWDEISSHVNDTSLNKKSSTCSWDIKNCQSFYHKFRIIMNGKNQNNHLYLCCSGFEIYGRFEKNFYIFF